LETFRQEFVERLTTSEHKVTERLAQLKGIRDHFEKVEENLVTFKNQVAKKLEEKADFEELHRVKSEMRGLAEGANELAHQTAVSCQEKLG